MSRRPHTAAAGSRVALSVVDQAVASLGNIALMLVVAHALPLDRFGSYALTLAGYQVFVTVGQAVVGEPLLVLSGRVTAAELRGALASSVLLGAAAPALLGLAWPVVRPPAELVALVLLMPVLLLQDGLRYAAFAARRPQVALLSDSVWTAGQVGATLAVLSWAEVSVPALVLAWGLPAVPAAVLQLLLLRTAPAGSGARQWVRCSRHLSRQYLGEAVTNLGAFQAVLYLTGVLGGLAAAGQLRVVQVLFGPVHVAVTGIRAFGIPEVARRVRSGIRCSPVVVACAAGLGSLSLSWTVAIALLPASWGAFVLGAGWSTTAGLVWLLGAQKTVECAGTGPFLVHRAKERAQWTFRVRAVATGLTVVLAALLTGRHGAAGASWAMLAGSVLAVTAWWVRYAAEDREHRARHRTGAPRHRAPGLPPRLRKEEVA